MRRSDGGSGRSTVDTMLAGASRRIADIVSGTVSPENARRPVSISYNTDPNAKMSARWSMGCARACSGAM